VGEVDVKQDEYYSGKASLRNQLLEQLGMEKLRRAQRSRVLVEELCIFIRSYLNRSLVPLGFAERERLVREVIDEILGIAIVILGENEQRSASL
jgi:hypothetical protein